MEDVPTQNPTNPTPTLQDSRTQEVMDPQPNRDKSKKRIYTLIIIFVFLFLVSAISLAMLIHKKGQDNTLFAPKTAPTSIPTPTDNSILKTYTNSSFSFNYPSDWILTDTSDSDFEPSVTVSKDDVSLKIYLSETEAKGLINVKTTGDEELSVGDKQITFKNYTTTVTGQPALYSSLNDKNLPFYTINIYLNKEDYQQNLLDIKNILSTFKFTNSTLTPTLTKTQNLKTYTNPFGFSIQYPSSLVYENSSTNNLVGFLEKQDELMSKRLSILVFNTYPTSSLSEILRAENLTPETGLVSSSQTVDGTNVEVLSEYKTMSELCNTPGNTKLSRVKYALVKNAKIQALFIPNDSCETYKTDWFTPILKTFKFTN